MFPWLVNFDFLDTFHISGLWTQCRCLLKYLTKTHKTSPVACISQNHGGPDEFSLSDEIIPLRATME